MKKASDERLRIGIICYPLIGGSGILASALGKELAKRGHSVHFFSYERPIRLDEGLPNVFFHPVQVSEYKFFEYADYTLPLSVRVAETVKSEGLDVVHAHYAVPHAIAAYMAKQMLGDEAFKLVTTLHGTDATVFGSDPNYRSAIEFGLRHSDAITAVSNSLREDSLKCFDVGKPIETVYNFFQPSEVSESRSAARQRLGIGEDEFLFLHMSNLRSVKRVDLLLDSFARAATRERCRLLILGGSDPSACRKQVAERGLEERVIVLSNGKRIENYVNASDAGLYTSEKESFCLGILETMFGGRPNAAFAVGGIPEVIGTDGSCGLLAPFGDVDAMSRSIDQLAGEGVAILFVSSEMEEIIGISDRVLVMREGKITGELNREQLSEEAVMALATQSA